jgi:CDP-diacylglycerol--serine O-phosphatidyltransferase
MTEPRPNDPADADDPAAPVPPRRKGIYVLPNAITLAALFAGFYAIVMAMNGRFETACIGIFCAAVLDSLDGRVARMTNTQSAFGEQMDSLADMVSFGAAPALIVYRVGAARTWASRAGSRPSSTSPGAALRLARFNVNIGVVDKRFFQGLPSPAAAALVMGLIWVVDDAGVKRRPHRLAAWSAFGVTLYAGLSMVTNAPFYSFKDVGSAHRALRGDRGHRAGHRRGRWTRRGCCSCCSAPMACRATWSTPGASSRASRSA